MRNIVLRVFAFVVAFAGLAQIETANGQTHLDTSIRLVHWDSVLDDDTVHFAFDSEASAYHTDINPTTDSQITPFYDVVSDSEQSGGTIDAVAFVDLNHDGREDAVITLFSGGSGHFATDVIFLQTLNGPKYSGCAGGPHFSDSINEDTLIIYTAHPLAMDPQCCNRAIDAQRIVGERDTIRWLPVIVEPTPGGGWQTVYDFYGELNDSDKQFAYSMLSESYRLQHPYSMWLKGFANTVSVDADVDKDSPDSAVRVTITSQDKIHGKIVTKHFSGIWHTQFVTNNRRMEDPMDRTDWLLDRPEIREVK
jgi:hypothetical protein